MSEIEKVMDRVKKMLALGNCEGATEAERCESRKIQLRTELGYSNWLDITPEQWRKIEAVLREES